MDRFNTVYSSVTQSLQALNNAISEILSIGSLTDDDVLALRYWMDDNIHLSGNYPFDKIYKIIDQILSDGTIDPKDKAELLLILEEENICDSEPAAISTLMGKHICLTGNFDFATRNEIEELISNQGGVCDKNVFHYTDYLFVGGKGSRDWAYGNYGNKVKRAKEFQERGHDLLILGEDSLSVFFDTHDIPLH